MVLLEHGEESGAARADEIGYKPNDENTKIAAKLQGNDPQIVEELMKRYQVRLRRYLVHLTKDGDLTEDILQETWIRVLTKGSQFKGDSQFITWLFAIARNLVVDLRRRRARTWNLDDFAERRDSGSFELEGKEKNPFEACSEKERAGMIARIWTRMRSEQRTVLELRFQCDMSLSEIAEATNAPLSTVKARLYRAQGVLRRQASSMASVGARVMSAA
ncbi:MAG TPA: sigma-70 family RNA polymerase sigma factor [Acidobacteriaceae bacterium]|nr:sigma-70 family RNA polymerase sigma factor [Acidobacteriaceae bacterium]